MNVSDLFEQVAQATQEPAPAVVAVPVHAEIPVREVKEATAKARARAVGREFGIQVRFYAPQGVMDKVQAAGTLAFDLSKATGAEEPKKGNVYAFLFENGEVFARITVPKDAETETVTLRF